MVDMLGQGKGIPIPASVWNFTASAAAATVAATTTATATATTAATTNASTTATLHHNPCQEQKNLVSLAALKWLRRESDLFHSGVTSSIACYISKTARQP